MRVFRFKGHGQRQLAAVDEQGNVVADEDPILQHDGVERQALDELVAVWVESPLGSHNQCRLSDRIVDQQPRI